MNIQLSLVVLDNTTDKVIARYTPDWVIDLSGFGVERNINEIQTETQRFITRIDPTLGDIGMTIIFDSMGDNAYLRNRSFKAWELEQVRLGRNISLERNDGHGIEYVSGVFQNIPLGERQVGRFLHRAVNFHPSSPWYKLQQRRAVIRQAIKGKTYPLTYPYTYGAMRITDNVLFNEFYKPVPLKVILYGFITDPIVQLLDEKGNIYSQIRLQDVSIEEGQHILLDGDVRQILKWNGTEYEDIFSSRNPGYDSFLQINPGLSTINWNPNPGENGWLEATRRQFTEL